MGLDILVAIVCHVVPVVVAILFVKAKARELKDISLREGRGLLIGDRESRKKAKILDKDPLKNPDVANTEVANTTNIPTSPSLRNGYGSNLPSTRMANHDQDEVNVPSVGGGIGGGTNMLGLVNVVGAIGQSGTMSNRFMAAQQITGAIFQGGSKVYNVKLQGTRNLEQGGSQIINTIQNRKKIAMKQGSDNKTAIQNIGRGRVNLTGRGNSVNAIYGNVNRVRLGSGTISTEGIQIKGVSKVQSMLASRFVAPKAAKVKIHQLASMNTMDGYGLDEMGGMQVGRLNGNTRAQKRRLRKKPSKNVYTRLVLMPTNMELVGMPSSTRKMPSSATGNVNLNSGTTNINTNLNASQGANVNTRLNASSVNTRLNASSGANVNARFTGKSNVPTNPRFAQLPKYMRKMITMPRVYVTNNRQNADITLNDLNTHRIQRYSISKNDSTIQANQLLTMASIKRIYEDPRNKDLQGRQKTKFYVASKIMENERVLKSGNDDYGYINKSNNDEELLRIAASNFRDLDANQLVRTVKKAREYQGRRENKDRNYAKRMVRERSTELNTSNRLAIESLLRDTSGEVGMHFDNLMRDMSVLTEDQIKEIEKKAEKNVKERENLSPEEREREHKKELERLKKEKQEENEKSYRELEIEKMLNDDEEARAILGEEGFDKFKKAVKENGRKAYQDELRKKRNQDDYYYRLKHQEHKELNPYEVHQERIKSEQEEDVQKAVNDLYREKENKNVNRVGPTPVPSAMYIPPRTNTENRAV